MYKNSEIDVKIDSKSVTKIQSLFKAYKTRKTYKIDHLPKNKQSSYNVLIKGNDPEQITGLPNHKSNEKIAFIGSSGMRSLEIACQLSQGTPKLIILDNSRYVTGFWRKAREIIKNAESKSEFISNLFYYVRITNCNRKSWSDEEFDYIEKLIDTHGYNKVKKIISNVSVIDQSWADTKILVKIKNILNHNGIKDIYVYPSNIVACSYNCNGNGCNCKKEAEQVLQNIEIINPVLAIHTDLVNCKPDNLFLIADHTPSIVMKKLGLEVVKNSSPSLDNEFIKIAIFQSIISQCGLFAGMQFFNRFIKNQESTVKFTELNENSDDSDDENISSNTSNCCN